MSFNSLAHLTCSITGSVRGRFPPQVTPRRRRTSVPALAVFLFLIGHLHGPTSANADEPGCRSKLASTGSSNIDGRYITIGPHGSATRLEDTWDTSFGGEVGFARIKECNRLGALGFTIGVSGYGERDGGRVFATTFVGTRRWSPWAWPALGVSAGIVFETDPVADAEPGYFGEVWAYLAVTPYARIGWVRGTGTFVDIGLRIPLPAFRF